MTYTTHKNSEGFFSTDLLNISDNATNPIVVLKKIIILFSSEKNPSYSKSLTRKKSKKCLKKM